MIDLAPPSELSGKMTDHRPYHNGQGPSQSMQQVWLFDVQWSDCPVEVAAEIRELWASEELNNGQYYAWSAGTTVYDCDTDEEVPFEQVYPLIHWWITKNERANDTVLIHWWW